MRSIVRDMLESVESTRNVRPIATANGRRWTVRPEDWWKFPETFRCTPLSCKLLF